MFGLDVYFIAAISYNRQAHADEVPTVHAISPWRQMQSSVAYSHDVPLDCICPPSLLDTSANPYWTDHSCTTDSSANRIRCWNQRSWSVHVLQGPHSYS